MKYDHGHWDSGKEAQQGECHEYSDPAASVPGGELHLNHVSEHGDHIGGVHGASVRVYNPPGADHTATDMSRIADEYLRLLG